MNGYKTNYNHFVIGDMNINLLEINDLTEDYKNNCAEFCYKLFIHKTVHVTKQNRFCVDHNEMNFNKILNI